VAKCVCYDNQGNTLELDGDERDLTDVGRAPLGTRDWNDAIVRIDINSGSWQFFRDIKFQGTCWQLSEGSHSPPEFEPHQISSIHCM
jgi:Beta/Gamma crystallin